MSVLLRSQPANHELLLQIASPDRPDRDFFYGFSTLRELQFTETSFLVMEPWQLSNKVWQSFEEEGKNLAEKRYQALGQYARTYGEITFSNYFMIYVLKNEQAMMSRISWAMEDSPLVRFNVWHMGVSKNNYSPRSIRVGLAADKPIR
jgi:hypothetical protein